VSGGQGLKTALGELVRKEVIAGIQDRPHMLPLENGDA